MRYRYYRGFFGKPWVESTICINLNRTSLHFMDVPNVRVNRFNRNNRLAYLGFKSCMCDNRISSDQVDREIGKVLRLVGQK